MKNIFNPTTKTFGYLSVLMTLCFLGTGCSKSEIKAQTSVVLPSDPIDTDELRKAFGHAAPGLKVGLDESMTLVRNRNYAEAIDQFKKLSRNPTLTPEQQNAINGALTQIHMLASGRPLH